MLKKSFKVLHWEKTEWVQSKSVQTLMFLLLIISSISIFPLTQNNNTHYVYIGVQKPQGQVAKPSLNEALAVFTNQATSIVKQKKDFNPQKHNSNALFDSYLNKLVKNNEHAMKVLNVKLLIQLVQNEASSTTGSKLNQKLGSYWPKLRALQTSNGRFANESLSQSSTEVSLSLMQLLTLIKEQGYNVPSDLFNLGLQNIRIYANPNKNTFQTTLTQARAVLLLTNNEIVTTNAIGHLQSYLKRTDPKYWQSQLSSLYLAVAYKLLANDEYASELATSYVNSNANLNSSAIYLLAKYFPKIAIGSIKIKNINNLLKRLNQSNHNVFASIQNLIALHQYSLLLTKKTAVPIKVRQFFNKKWQAAHTTFSSEATQLKITKVKKQDYFYQIITNGSSGELLIKPASHSLNVAMKIFNNQIYTENLSMWLAVK